MGRGLGQQAPIIVAPIYFDHTTDASCRLTETTKRLFWYLSVTTKASVDSLTLVLFGSVWVLLTRSTASEASSRACSESGTLFATKPNRRFKSRTPASVSEITKTWSHEESQMKYIGVGCESQTKFADTTVLYPKSTLFHVVDTVEIHMRPNPILWSDV